MFSQLFLMISIFGSFPLIASDTISGDFSGQSPEKVLAEIAKVGKINIIGDFPDQKIPCARFKDEVYYEEAFNLAAKSCGLMIRRIDKIWLILPDDRILRLDKEMVITKSPHYRSPSSFEEPMRPLLSSQMKIWLPPLSSLIAMSASKEYLDELKKVFETLDTPVHSVQIDVMVKQGEAQTTIASASFMTRSWSPFRLKYSSLTNQSVSFDWQGLLGMNDDGNLHGKLRFETKIDGERALFSHELAVKDQQWVNHNLEVAGTRMTVSLRGTAVNMFGSILPPVEASTDEPSRALEEFGLSSTPGLAEIPHREATVLKKPLIFSRAPIAQVIEQLATMEKIPIVCDADVSGTVSVYCYGEEVNLVDLIVGIARAKGYEVFPQGEGLIVAGAKAIQDMTIAETQPYISGKMYACSPASARKALIDGFKECGISGTVEVQPESSLKIKADTNGRWLAETLSELWGKPLTEFPLGVQVFSGKERFEDMQPVTMERFFDKSWKTSGGTLQVRLSPAVIDPVEGLCQVNISLERKDSRQGNWSLYCTSGLPDDPATPLFNSQGNAPLRVNWKGTIAAKSWEIDQEQIAPSSSSDDFDDAFDSSF